MRNILIFLTGPTGVIVVGGLVTTVAGFLVAYHQNPPARLLKRLAVAAAIGGVLAIIGGVWAGYQQDRDGADLMAKTDAIAQLSARIADLTSVNAAMLTGGESFCYFDPVETSPNEFTWYLVRMGRGTQAPLYDVRGSVLDVNALRTQPQPGTPSVPNPQALAAARKTFSLGTLNPSESRVFQKTNLSGMKSQAYIIDFQARNGTWTQVICFEFAAGKWTRAVRFQPDHDTRAFISSDWWLTGNFPSNAIPWQ
jgi:hypothetical protein